MGEVIQRSIHFIYFAIRGNPCPGFPRLDRDLFRNQNIAETGNSCGVKASMSVRVCPVVSMK